MRIVMKKEKTMRIVMISGLVLFGICFINPVFAGEDGDAPKDAPKKEKKAKKEHPPMEEMTISGTITKTEKKSKKGDVRVRYLLTDDAGNKIFLPTPRKPRKKKGKKGEAAPEAATINFEDFVDAKVTVVGKGYTKEKKGKKYIHLKKIDKIDKAE